MQIDTVYLAAEGFVSQLEEELLLAGQKIIFQRDRLIGCKGSPYHSIWAQNAWQSPYFIPISSISKGAKALRDKQRNWVLFPTVEQGRSRLIQEQLPVVSGKPLVFQQPLPTSPLGSWTMWDRTTVLASAHCSSPVPNGAYLFEEDKKNPPNRAYLKLWEGFTRLGVMPKQGDLCVDLGSSPGGWTWVLANLGARVFSIDKAPLAPHIASHPLVEYCNGSAFGFEPKVAGEISWLFSDVACYPERLYQLVMKWLEQGECKNFFCTIKLSGHTDFAMIDRFLAIPKSTILHLYCNKHEVTWVRME